MKVSLEWATPDVDKIIARQARVSNPSNQDNPKIEGLIKYMLREGHVSPFEMANVCLEIHTTRDIARQVLRHRSFSFQEFSQRYADVEELPPMVFSECRLQHPTNRQSSIEVGTDSDQSRQWLLAQQRVMSVAMQEYRWALQRGVAKEVARKLLPEGLTSSLMYMNGTLRSWIFYLKSRLDPSTQKEHRLVAEAALPILRGVAPVTIGAFFPQEEQCNQQQLSLPFVPR